MQTFLAPLERIHAFTEAKESIDRGRFPLHISGCMDSQKVHFIYGLLRIHPGRSLLRKMK